MFESLRSELTLSAGDYVRSANKAERASDDLADSTDELEDSAQSTSKGLSTAQKAVAGVGGAAAAVGAAGIVKSVQAFGDFDQQLTQSTAIMGDVSDSMRSKLGQTARDVTGKLGTSSDEAAQSYYYLASAGLDAQQSLEAMPKVSEFAAAGQMDMARATDYATDVASAFGIEAKNLTTVTDSMTATVTRHNSTMEGMGEAMSYVAPVASGLGVSIETTSAAIGALSDAGIKGSKAGTTLRQALAKLSNPTKSTKEVFKKLGVQLTNSHGKMRSFTDIMADLKASGASTADVMKAFGTRAGPGMQVLLEKGGSALARESDKIASMGGITKQVAEKQLATFNKQVDILKSKVQNAAIVTGSAFAPALISVMKSVGKLIDRFNGANEASGGFLGKLSLLSTVVGGVAAVLAALTIGPVAGIAAGLLAAGGAAATMTGHFATVRTQTSRVANTLRSEFLAALMTLKTTIGPIATQIAGAWASMGGRVGSVAGGLVTDIGDKLTGAIHSLGVKTQQWLTKIAGWWVKHGVAVTTTVTKFSTHFQEAIIQAMAAVRSIIAGDTQQFVYFVKQFARESLAAARSLGITLPKPVKKALTKIVSAVSGKLSTALGWWTTHKTKVTNKAKQAYQTAKTKITTALSKASTAVKTTLNKALGWWTTHKTKLKQKVTSAYQTVKSTISTKLGAAKRVIQTALAKIIGWWTTHKTKLKQKVTSAYQTVKSTISTKLGAAKRVVTSTLSTVVGAWNSHKTAVKKKAKQAYSGAKSKISSVLSTLSTKVVSPALGAAKKQWDNHKKDIKRVGGGAVDWLKGHWQTVLSALATVVVPGPLGLILTAVQRNFGKIKTTAKKTFKALKSVVKTTMKAVKRQIINPLHKSGSETSKTLGSIKREFSQTLGVVRDIVSRVMGTVLSVWNDHVNGIASTWKTNLTGNDGIIHNARTAFNSLWFNIIKPILDTIQAAWNRWGDSILGVLRGALNTLLSVAQIGMDAILTAINVVLDLLSGDWEGAWTDIKGFLQRTINTIGSWLSSTGKSVISTAIDVVVTAIKAPFEAIYDFLIGNSLIPDLLGDIVSAITNWNVGEVLGRVIDGLADAFAAFATTVIGGSGSIVKGLLSDIITAIVTWNPTEPMGRVLGYVKDKFSDLATDVIGGGESIVKGLIGDITSYIKNDAKDDVVAAFHDLGHAIESAFGDMARWAKSAFNGVMPDTLGIPEITLPKVSFHVPGLKIAGHKIYGGQDIGVGPFGPFGGNSVDIPQLAEGGIVDAPTLALIGEAGPEAVVPLGRGRSPDMGAGDPQDVDVTVTLTVDGDDELTRLIRENADVQIDERVRYSKRKSKRQGVGML